MSKKSRFQPQVDRFESRALLTAGAAAAPLAVAAVPTLHVQGVHATAATQAVIQIKNTSSLNVGFSFRWTSTGSWQNYTVNAGGGRTFWINDSSSLKPQIQFDQSVLPGNQNKIYTLSYFTYQGTGGTPPNSAAKIYQFKDVSGGVDLYSITTKAVTSFKNSSNITVAFKFRWNSSSSYSNTVNLAPGKTVYFVTSPPTASYPTVQFDQSVLPGWQTKTYKLGFNVYTGSSPTSSAGKLYTFKTVSGGVHLYG